MGKKKDKSGGRDVVVVSLTETEVTAVEKGHFYSVVSKKRSESQLPAGIIAGKVFLAEEAIPSLSGEDKVIDLGTIWDADGKIPHTVLVGFANSKDLSQTKSTFDATTDGDDDSDQRSDGLVSRSGNFNGIKYNNEHVADSASAKLAARFIDTVEQTAEGITVTEASTPIDLIAFIYAKAKPLPGNRVEIIFLPCILSTDGESSSYNNATTRNIAFVGCAATDKGTKPHRGVYDCPAV